MGNLPHLGILYLQSNQLQGEFPASITNLTNLMLLNFDCSLTSTDPDVITFIHGISSNWPARCLRTISGNTGVGDVTLSYVDGTAKTVTADGTGNYSVSLPYGWSGTITPSKTGYNFMPSAKVYTNITTNMTGQDFIASGIVLGAPSGSLTSWDGASTGRAFRMRAGISWKCRKWMGHRYIASGILLRLPVWD